MSNRKMGLAPTIELSALTLPDELDISVAFPAYDITTKVGRRRIYLALADELGHDDTERNLYSRLERAPKWERKNFTTDRTILQPVVDFLNRNGIPTDHTVGSLMETLHIPFWRIHSMACDCKAGVSTNATHSLSRHFRILARRSFVEWLTDTLGLGAKA